MKSELPKYRRTALFLFATFVFLFLILFLGLRQYNALNNPPLPFQLTDQNGAIFNSKAQNDYKLIFFGFTNCPSICPTGLLNIQAVLEQLGQDKSKIQAIFITVDPERDTLAVIKEYLNSFQANFIGLTGSKSELEHVRDMYAVYAKKIEAPEFEEYVMDHSAHIYFTNPDDVVLDVFDYRLASDKISEKILQYINSEGL